MAPSSTAWATRIGRAWAQVSPNSAAPHPAGRASGARPVARASVANAALVARSTRGTRSGSSRSSRAVSGTVTIGAPSSRTLAGPVTTCAARSPATAVSPEVAATTNTVSRLLALRAANSPT